MSSGFSGVLQLTDLDDFITPSQVILLISMSELNFLSNKIDFFFKCYIILHV